MRSAVNLDLLARLPILEVLDQPPQSIGVLGLDRGDYIASLDVVTVVDLRNDFDLSHFAFLLFLPPKFGSSRGMDASK